MWCICGIYVHLLLNVCVCSCMSGTAVFVHGCSKCCHNMSFPQPGTFRASLSNLVLRGQFLPLFLTRKATDYLSLQLTCWSSDMLPCAPDTVYTVLSWIRSISCGSGRNLLAALSSGLTDPACHAIHLITANLPEHPEAVLTALPALAAGRPVNIFYLQASLHSDQNVKYYLQCLARATRGRCYVLPVGLNGELGEVGLNLLYQTGLEKAAAGSRYQILGSSLAREVKNCNLKSYQQEKPPTFISECSKGPNKEIVLHNMSTV